MQNTMTYGGHMTHWIIFNTNQSALKLCNTTYVIYVWSVPQIAFPVAGFMFLKEVQKLKGNEHKRKK